MQPALEEIQRGRLTDRQAALLLSQRLFLGGRAVRKQGFHLAWYIGGYMPSFKMERRLSESEDRLVLGEICLLIDAAEGIMRRRDVIMWKTKKKERQRQRQAERERQRERE